MDASPIAALMMHLMTGGKSGAMAPMPRPRPPSMTRESPPSVAGDRPWMKGIGQEQDDQMWSRPLNTQPPGLK